MTPFKFACCYFQNSSTRKMNKRDKRDSHPIHHLTPHSQPLTSHSVKKMVGRFLTPIAQHTHKLDAPVGEMLRLARFNLVGIRSKRSFHEKVTPPLMVLDSSKYYQTLFVPLGFPPTQKYFLTFYRPTSSIKRPPPPIPHPTVILFYSSKALQIFPRPIKYIFLPHEQVPTPIKQPITFFLPNLIHRSLFFIWP